MEVESAAPAATEEKLFLAINCLLIAIGNIGGPLIVRLYFLNGGQSIWFSSWLQTAGWPLMLIPLLVSYTRRRGTSAAAAELVLMEPRVAAAAAALGVMIGLGNYTYSSGLAKLPVSTSSLLVATQLVFTAAFAFVVVKQRFTAYSINAVVLLTAAAVILGVHAGGDRPEGETDKDYWRGFTMTLAAAALYGFALPLVELTYNKAKQVVVTYALVMEVQLVLCFFATAFATVGMFINKDFQVIRREAQEFQLGEEKYYYYLVVASSAMIWQCSFLGVIGVVFYASSLFSGIIITLCLPITQLLALLFYHEKFQSEKGLSLFLSLWGFISYFTGHIKHKKMTNHHQEDADKPMIDQSTHLAIQTIMS